MFCAGEKLDEQEAHENAKDRGDEEKKDEERSGHKSVQLRDHLWRLLQPWFWPVDISAGLKRQIF